MRLLAGVFVAAGLLGAWFYAGLQGLLGMALGLAGTTFNLAALWGVIGLTGGSQNRGERPAIGFAILVIGLFVKLPLLLLMGAFAQGISVSAANAFIAGLLLVYLWLFIFGFVDAHRKVIAQRDAAIEQIPRKNGQE